MSENERAGEEVEIESDGVGEKSKLLAYVRNEIVLEQRAARTSSCIRPRNGDGGTGEQGELGEARLEEEPYVDSFNKEEKNVGKEAKDKNEPAFPPQSKQPTRALQLRVLVAEENGHDQRGSTWIDPIAGSTDSAGASSSTAPSNYGTIRKTSSHEVCYIALEDPLATSHQQPLLAAGSDRSRSTSVAATMTASEYRYRRYSAISAPAVSLLHSIADDDESRADDQPVHQPPLVVRFEESPKAKTVSTTATTSVATDSTTRKSTDELRRVLTKRWHQLARHRLVVLHFLLVAYLLAFLIAYACLVQGQTRLSVILVTCSLIGYCSILVLLCVACPVVSTRPIFLNLASGVTATLWPLLSWLMILCSSGSENTIAPNWAANGLPSMLFYICALYGSLTFPQFVDGIWGLAMSTVHLVVTYIKQTSNGEVTTQELCANILILLMANAFGLFLSLALRRSREFMWRQFDDSIEKRATVEYEKERQEQLLLSIIPAHLAARVRKTILNRASKTRESIDTSSEQPRLFHDLHVQQHENVSILFADIVNFTPLTAELTAPQLVRFLNELYSRFDELAQEFQCMRIKILGDCYYCVSGMPVSRPNHADNCVKMALAMIEAIKSLREAAGINMDMRIGVHSGSVLCGILGLKKWQYDIWSDDVTIANHMEQGGRPGKVHITKATLQLLSGGYNIIPASTNDPYILAQHLETYFILPSSDTNLAQLEAVCTPSSVEDIFVAVNGCSAPLAQLTGNQAQLTGNQNLLTTAGKVQREEKKENKELKVFSTSNKSFDRAKSFSFRQYHGTTDATGREKSQKRAALQLINKNVLSSESFGQQRQTAKMSKIIEFWGGADTPFSNLSRRRSSDHVRAASITAIENNYKQYRWRDLASLKNNRWASGNGVLKVCCCGAANRREGTTAANMLLDGALTYSDASVEESFYQNAEPIRYAASITTATVVTFFVGVIGSTSMLAIPDVATSVIFSIVLLSLAVICVFQWNQQSNRKLTYVPSIVSFDNYESFSKRIVPSLVLMLSMTLPIVFLTTCARAEKCSNKEYDVCLFQLTLLIIICACRPGFLPRCGVVLIFLIIFMAIFFHPVTVSDGNVLNQRTDHIGNVSSVNATTLPDGLAELPFELRAIFSLSALVFLVICISWLVEYEAKVDWLCVTSFRVEQEDVETMQDINMILLHNILPAHVAEHFLRPERPPEELYHENHPYVCVMFASIPNFKDFWSQWDFSRQLECLRLLNEIVCEFDKLLAKPKYSNVEKIKTVGSTYMAVCGLHSNPALRLDPRRYAAIMVEFAFAMINILDQLNRDSFQNFQLRIGMSFGPVVAGVIGAQKPQYDIWGNTVNVASRMDTHGAMGKIHVTQDAAAALQASGYELESRGMIKIKGIKNEVETYFVYPAPDRRSVAY